MTRRGIWTAFGTIGATIGLALAAIALLVWAWPAAAQAAKVRLQLKWVTQAQFAGYYAAKSQGFYKTENLDVTIIPGGPGWIRAPRILVRWAAGDQSGTFQLRPGEVRRPR